MLQPPRMFLTVSRKTPPEKSHPRGVKGRVRVRLGIPLGLQSGGGGVSGGVFLEPFRTILALLY